MSPELEMLYQELIIDHGLHPRNRCPLDQATHSAEGVNPVCGDTLRIHLKIDNQSIQAATFEGAGCAISTASASLMTECLCGKTVSEADALFKGFHDWMTTDASTASSTECEKLLALAGVKAFPMRIKCATLAWHTLRAALKQEDHIVSTE